MSDQEWLAERFEANRPRLRAVAYRMLGSLSEADDAVQEAWLRLTRADADGIANLSGWLTTVVGRVCLDMLRARRSRREEPLPDRLPDLLIDGADGVGPEHQTLLADSLGLALLVVLETLNPLERLAFVLHDIFGVSFADIAPVVDRSPAAARQLASRARRRVRAQQLVPDDLETQWEVAEAFLKARRDGNFEQLLTLLDPDVVLRVDLGPDGGWQQLRGVSNVAKQALAHAHQPGLDVRRALVNGAVGAVSFRDGLPVSIAAVTIRRGAIVALDILNDPTRLRKINLAVLGG